MGDSASDGDGLRDRSWGGPVFARKKPKRRWHAKTCPLYEVAPHDCAYNVMACTCDYEEPDGR